MRVYNSVKNRAAAKSLLDVEIEDNTWKPDFDLADRYQSFANELMRIALLGIAGYGFLIKEICMKNDKYIFMLANFRLHICIGVVFLIIALALILSHRFLSTSCLYRQILIMRSLKRLENGNWNEEEKSIERKFLAETREGQRKVSYNSDIILKFACVFFSLGFLFVVIVFYDFLTAIPVVK
jgi:hypothetical protein